MHPYIFPHVIARAPQSGVETHNVPHGPSGRPVPTIATAHIAKWDAGGGVPYNGISGNVGAVALDGPQQYTAGTPPNEMQKPAVC